MFTPGRKPNHKFEVPVAIIDYNGNLQVMSAVKAPDGSTINDFGCSVFSPDTLEMVARACVIFSCCADPAFLPLHSLRNTHWREKSTARRLELES